MKNFLILILGIGIIYLTLTYSSHGKTAKEWEEQYIQAYVNSVETTLALRDCRAKPIPESIIIYHEATNAASIVGGKLPSLE